MNNGDDKDDGPTRAPGLWVSCPKCRVYRAHVEEVEGSPGCAFETVTRFFEGESTPNLGSLILGNDTWDPCGGSLGGPGCAFGTLTGLIRSSTPKTSDP